MRNLPPPPSTFEDEDENEEGPIELGPGDFVLVFRENEVFIGAEDLDFEAESRIRFLREYLKFAFENKECLEAFNRMQTELN
jgi:hypothetical protein